jgi:hypothetical protein
MNNVVPQLSNCSFTAPGKSFPTLIIQPKAGLDGGGRNNRAPSVAIALVSQ